MADEAQAPLPPGEVLGIGDGSLAVTVAPAAGGRIAQVRREDLDWLVGYGADSASMISWGCYPMLPSDERWPFGGHARQHLAVAENSLRMDLVVSAGERAMPAVVGWHPWFRKPEALEFKPSRFYPRDAEHIATRPLADPPPAPWDDCFINGEPVILSRAGQHLRLTSNCHHWVVYDEPAHATCIEPQSGPPDAFNLDPVRYLAPGMSTAAWFLWEWF